jgi:hypothetical protein
MNMVYECDRLLRDIPEKRSLHLFINRSNEGNFERKFFITVLFLFYQFNTFSSGEAYYQFNQDSQSPVCALLELMLQRMMLQQDTCILQLCPILFRLLRLLQQGNSGFYPRLLAAFR